MRRSPYGPLLGLYAVIGAGAMGRSPAAWSWAQPPGPELEGRLRDLLDWMGADHPDLIDAVVAAAMLHHVFETLHPFNDGNGRIGRRSRARHLRRVA